MGFIVKCMKNKIGRVGHWVFKNGGYAWVKARYFSDEACISKRRCCGILLMNVLLKTTRLSLF